MEVDYNDSNSILVTRKASEPLDILWKNMGIITNHFQFMRFFMIVIGLVLIIFLSSPAVLLAKVKQADPTHFLEMDWTNDVGHFGPFIRKVWEKKGDKTKPLRLHPVLVEDMDGNTSDWKFQ